MEVEYLAKKRVYEVAKQLNISNKDLIDKLKGIGVEVSNHMASIDDATIEKVTELLAPKKEEKKAEEKPAAPAEAKRPNSLRITTIITAITIIATEIRRITRTITETSL